MRALALSAILILGAGCLEDSAGPTPPQGPAYPGALIVVEDESDGSSETQKEIQVPEGKGFLTVYANYSVDGSAAFQLTDPSGRLRHADSVSGSKSLGNHTWAVLANPAPGTWTLRVAASGTIAYVFAFYATGEGTFITDLYEDARLRFVNTVSGSETSSKNIEIPLNTGHLLVRAAYSIEGSGSLALRDPAFMTRQSDSVSGTKDVEDTTWYETDQPVFGTWKLEIAISGSGAYAFGVYY